MTTRNVLPTHAGTLARAHTRTHTHTATLESRAFAENLVRNDDFVEIRFVVASRYQVKVLTKRRWDDVTIITIVFVFVAAADAARPSLVQSPADDGDGVCLVGRQQFQRDVDEEEEGGDEAEEDDLSAQLAAEEAEPRHNCHFRPSRTLTVVRLPLAPPPHPRQIPPRKTKAGFHGIKSA